MLGVLPELAAELLAEKEEKKERNVDNLGLLNVLRGAVFFLCESEESEEWDASLAERGRVDDGPADLSASEMSCRPCPRLDMVLSRSTSALRHCGVLAESVKSGVPGPRSSPWSSSTRSGERVDLAATCETGTALDETERVRARLARPLRAEEELAAADCPSNSAAEGGIASSYARCCWSGLPETDVALVGCSVLARTRRGGEDGSESVGPCILV